MAKNESNTAENQNQQGQQQEPTLDQKVAEAVKKAMEGYTKPTGFFSVLIGHPVAHLMSPGFANKAEGVLGLGGRIGVGYGIYKGIRFGIEKIWG